MKRLLLLALTALGLCGCVFDPPHVPTPPEPTTYTLKLRVTDEATGQILVGAFVFSDRAPTPAFPKTFVGDSGVAAFLLDNAAWNACAEMAGYLTRCEPVARPIDQQIEIRLTRGPPPALPNAGERGPLHVDGLTFRRQDGSIFPWRGFSDFALLARYIRGEDVQPILDQRIAGGRNLLRVFTMFDRFGIGAAAGVGELNPNTIPDFYAKLGAFADLLAARGMRVQFVVLADADERNEGGTITGGLMPTVAMQQAHLTRVLQTVAGKWNVLLCWANEPFKNAVHVLELTGDCHAAGVLCDYGIETADRGQRTIPHLDYLGQHDHERKEDWPRTARALGELRDGFSWRLDDPACRPNCSQHPDNSPDFEGVHVPVVGDEPKGLAELERGSRAGRRPDEQNTPVAQLQAVADAAYYAGTAALMGAGSTFHSDDGIASRLLGPVQLEALAAWDWASRWVPAEAQLAPYQRGGDCGSAGIGNMPVEHCDLGSGSASEALRTFAKYAFAAEWVIRIRGVGPAVPRDGWQIRREPRRNFLELVRP